MFLIGAGVFALIFAALMTLAYAPNARALADEALIDATQPTIHVGAPLLTLGEEENSATASNAPVVKRSGIWGSCPWTLDSEGVLTILPGETDYDSFTKDMSGAEQRSIKRIVFKSSANEKVVGGDMSSGMFQGLTNLESIDFSGSSVVSVGAIPA